MKSILLDTNIILDIALRREPHFYHSSKLFRLFDEKLIEGYITATTSEEFRVGEFRVCGSRVD